MHTLAVVILAAGLGKRFGSSDPKVVVASSEGPLIQHVLATTHGLKAKKTIVVTGHKRELVEQVIKSGAGSKTYDLNGISFVYQEKQLGTGDAVKSALGALQDFVGTILILYGDVPLLKPETLQALCKLHSEEKSTLSFITLKSQSNNSYGRVLRDSAGKILRVVEAKDCGSSEMGIDEFNSGIYAVDSAFLAPAIEALKNNNSQKEYYLTDIVEQAVKEGQRVSAFVSFDSQELQGVNDALDLALINRVLLKRRVEALIQSGVIVEDPSSFYIETAVKVASGVKIGPNVKLTGKTVLQEGVVIEGNAYISDASIESGARIKYGVRIDGANIGKAANVGPFAHIRPGTVLEDEVKIGNFVETKKAHLKKGAKASHLTYLGDVSIGENSNIGAGTITCNYDGYKKFQTVIGAEVFIGSNTALVAPVEIKDGATIGAGSVITKTVEKDSLAFTRPPQVTKPGWSKKKRDKQS